MKKLLTIVAVAGAFAFVACGPSAADQAKKQHMQDSLKQDSMAKAQAASMAAQKAKADSAAKAASMTDSTKKDSAAK